MTVYEVFCAFLFAAIGNPFEQEDADYCVEVWRFLDKEIFGSLPF